VEQYLDVEKCLEKFKNKKYIDNEEILDCLLKKYSLRSVQRWALEICFLKKGTKNRHRIYLWNKDDIRYLGKKLNRKRRPASKPREVKDEINFLTIKDVVDELYKSKKKKKNIERKNVSIKIEKYCKRNKCKKEKHFNRWYYVLNEDMKTEIIKDFQDKGYKKAIRPPVIKFSISIKEKELKLLEKIAAEEYNVKRTITGRYIPIE
jgi:predicted transcriptional regulator